MKCPLCKTELIVSGQERLETLEDHVFNYEPSLKDAYTCPNTSCSCNKEDVCWSACGECYGGYNVFGFNQQSAPFGTHARQAEIEIYKKGLKKDTRLPAFLLLWFLRPVIEWSYKADMDGNVIKKSWTLSIRSSETPWRPFKADDEFCIGTHWWIRTWKFLWDKHKSEGFSKSYNRDFPYRAFEWFVKFFKL